MDHVLSELSMTRPSWVDLHGLAHVFIDLDKGMEIPHVPMNSMKRQKDKTLKDELPRSVGAQYATGDQWRNKSRKNEGMEPKQNNTQLWV